MTTDNPNRIQRGAVSWIRCFARKDSPAAPWDEGYISFPGGTLKKVQRREFEALADALLQRAEQAEAERDSEERWANHYKAERDEAIKERDEARQQIAVLRAALEEIRDRCTVGMVEAYMRQIATVALSNTAADAEAHDAKVRVEALADVLAYLGENETAYRLEEAMREKWAMSKEDK